MEIRSVVVPISRLTIQLHPLGRRDIRSRDLRFLSRLPGTGQNSCRHKYKQSYFCAYDRSDLFTSPQHCIFRNLLLAIGL